MPAIFKLISNLDQYAVILPVLRKFGIISKNLGYFVLDNTSNNNTILVEFSKKLDFVPKQRRLWYTSHVFNLIAETYLFGQDTKSFDDNFKKTKPGECYKL
jgi:hypothetical protein